MNTSFQVELFFLTRDHHETMTPEFKMQLNIFINDNIQKYQIAIKNFTRKIKL